MLIAKVVTAISGVAVLYGMWTLHCTSKRTEALSDNIQKRAEELSEPITLTSPYHEILKEEVAKEALRRLRIMQASQLSNRRTIDDLVRERDALKVEIQRLRDDNMALYKRLDDKNEG